MDKITRRDVLKQLAMLPAIGVALTRMPSKILEETDPAPYVHLGYPNDTYPVYLSNDQGPIHAFRLPVIRRERTEYMFPSLESEDQTNNRPVFTKDDWKKICQTS